MTEVIAILFMGGVVAALAWIAFDVGRLRKEIKKKNYYDDDRYF